MNEHMTMKTISEMTARYGVTARSLRYWESEGLLSPLREHGGRVSRLYDATQERRVRLILRGKALGLSICDIATGLDDTKLSVPDAILTQIEEETLDKQAGLDAQLAAIRLALRLHRDPGSHMIVLTEAG